MCICIIGDIMLDRYVEGTTTRISPEAPVPVMKIKNEQTYLGGAGNVYRNLEDLGTNAQLLTVIGNDNSGKIIQNWLSSKPVTERDRITTTKTRYLANSQHVLRIDNEVNEDIKSNSKDKIIKRYRNLNDRVLILSDYNKGVLQDPTFVQALIQIAHQKGSTVIVDPKGKDWTKYKGADIITPNLKELSEVFGIKIDNDDFEVVAYAAQAHDLYNIKYVLVTRSEKGVTLVSSNNEFVHYPAKVKDVYDVSGAGDTVVATLAYYIYGDTTVEDAVNKANIAGGIVVGKKGTSSVTRLEIEKNKIVNVEDLKVYLSNQNNKRIGFTNGCFDLLHAGHVQLLEKAKELCDILVVGLNSDSSVKRLKGNKRPIQPESTRSLVLSSLSCVDFVIIFDEDTPEQLIKQIRPDILVKGADYEKKEIIGKSFVESYGGKVVLIPLVEGVSTTLLINQMRQ